MKIRGRLLFGFGFYILFAAALGLAAFLELRTVSARLGGVEAADDLANTLLEVRRYEKNYLLYRDAESSRSLRRYLGELRAGVGRLEAGAAGEGVPGAFAAMQAATAAYERIFDEISGEAQRPEPEREHLERLRTTARELQTLVEDYAGRQRTGIDELLRRSRRTIRWLPVVLLVAVAVGVAVDAGLSRSIAGPIGKLEALTHSIAEGDFSQRVKLAGEDEFSDLGRAFNRMQDRLHDTMTTLELANEELRRNRAQLLEAERFAALGRFAAGVAHEINNPLAVINEQAGLLQDYLAREAPSSERERFAGPLAAITDSVARGSAVTSRILNFAGSTAVTVEQVDVNALVADVLGSLQPQLREKHLLLTLELQPDLPPIHTGRAQLRQAFGDVVRARLAVLARGGSIRVHSGLADGRAVRVVVRDTGPGPDPATLEHLAQPFSTTRAVGLDPGLGLWVSHGIMRKLGGDLRVAADPEGGTVFTLELPLEPPVPPPA